MASPVLPGLVRAVMHYSYNGGEEEATNTLHFLADSLDSWTLAEINALDDLVNSFQVTLKPNRYSASVYDKTTYYDFTAATPAIYERTAGHAGTSAGQPLPLECAAVCSIRTGVPGRSARGRIYFPHMTSSDLDVVSSKPAIALGATADLADALALLLGGDVGFRGGVYSTVNNSWISATEVIVNGDWDTQRRRGRLSLPGSTGTV